MYDWFKSIEGVSLSVAGLSSQVKSCQIQLSQVTQPNVKLSQDQKFHVMLGKVSPFLWIYFRKYPILDMRTSGPCLSVGQARATPPGF